jgi:hypothetical protein
MHPKRANIKLLKRLENIEQRLDNISQRLDDILPIMQYEINVDYPIDADNIPEQEIVADDNAVAEKKNRKKDKS